MWREKGFWEGFIGFALLTVGGYLMFVIGAVMR